MVGYTDEELEEYETMLLKSRYAAVVKELAEHCAPLLREKEKLDELLARRAPRTPPEEGPAKD